MQVAATCTRTLMIILPCHAMHDCIMPLLSMHTCALCCSASMAVPVACAGSERACEQTSVLEPDGVVGKVVSDDVATTACCGTLNARRLRCHQLVDVSHLRSCT